MLYNTKTKFLLCYNLISNCNNSLWVEILVQHYLRIYTSVVFVQRFKEKHMRVASDTLWHVKHT